MNATTGVFSCLFSQYCFGWDFIKVFTMMANRKKDKNGDALSSF